MPMLAAQLDRTKQKTETPRSVCMRMDLFGMLFVRMVVRVRAVSTPCPCPMNIIYRLFDRMWGPSKSSYVLHLCAMWCYTELQKVNIYRWCVRTWRSSHMTSPSSKQKWKPIGFLELLPRFLFHFLRLLHGNSVRVLDFQRFDDIVSIIHFYCQRYWFHVRLDWLCCLQIKLPNLSRETERERKRAKMSCYVTFSHDKIPLQIFVSFQCFISFVFRCCFCVSSMPVKPS